MVSAGSFISLKCFDLGLRAFARMGDPDALFILVGDGPERADLERLARDLRVGSQVEFTGWLDRPALLERVRQADAFLFPSARDGGGAVVVEAMAAGTPVVCLDTGGPGYHIQDAWGIRIAPGTAEQVVEDMARALQRLRDDPELRARMGAAGRQRVQDAYLWDRLGERLHAIYRRASDRSGPSNK